MHLSSILLAGICAAAVGAIPSTHNHVVHEKRTAEPRHWEKKARLNPKAVLPMRIGLTQRNLDKGGELLMEISRHDSPKYGQHYSPEEIIEIFAPAQDSVDAVKSWLESAGIEAQRISQSVNKQWIQFDAKVEEAERILKTEYHSYEHKSSGVSNPACSEYHVPLHVQEHVDYITPGLRLMTGGKTTEEAKKKKRSFRTGNAKFSGPILGPILQGLKNKTIAEELAECDTYITPPCIAAMYNITQATKAASGNMMGIFEEGDFYDEESLILFFATFAQNIPITTTPKLEGIDGGFAPGLYATGESDLDLQISYPIIYPQNSVIFQTDDLNYAEGIEGGGGFLNTFFDAIDGSYCTYSAFGETGNASIDPVYPDPLPTGYEGQLQCGVYKPTNVISISYGEQEDDLPTNYQQRQCSEMMKLGMQGVSIILASGDSGVAARSTDDNNADGCLGTGEVFNPDFPASCPYLTAVGATYLPPGANYAKDEEISVTRFPSGGGFSNIYPQPSYQNTTLATYFTQHDPGYKYYSTSGTNNPSAATTNRGIYNRAGRGYPDVSAVGDNVLIYVNGRPTVIGGTSASAPVFGAILNRINEERLAVGKKTVGFVNPTLYANPGMFHDITNGTNPGCNTNGFSAVEGWDPLSGLGTPNYPAMLEVFMALP
ncbi:Tripeptidyl-peptidase [Lachnellula suecica]|uniref:tripeptidyl-peptidase II n=1 Tax=Lachnellula suecica TaxID=602035 RepID=A0A8T9C6J0_9HELO|nr:Tripeptidyl-peptidase [Lachnellula suecica]